MKEMVKETGLMFDCTVPSYVRGKGNFPKGTEKRLSLFEVMKSETRGETISS